MTDETTSNKTSNDPKVTVAANPQTGIESIVVKHQGAYVQVAEVERQA